MKNSSHAVGITILRFAAAFAVTVSVAIAQTTTTQKPEYAIAVTDVATPAMPEIQMLKLGSLATESVMKGLPEKYVGKAAVVSTDGEDCLSESFDGKRRKSFAVLQGSKETRTIKVEGGAMTLSGVVSQIGDDSIAEDTADGVVLRLPLLIAPTATLVVRGKETANVRLVTKRGAFIANQGKLFVDGATVSSWDEDSKKSTPLLPDANVKSFRPFVSAYAGSDTRLAGSTFRDLGYDAPSGYGISLTSHPKRNAPKSDAIMPKGVIANCIFDGLYYGFYSYEARDVMIIGNQFENCVKYGIDPHDRSVRLTIARNTISGTNGHGIIASREVSDSFVFGNVVKANAGDGIVLDRQCSRNVIANNLVFDNRTGIAIFESSKNRILGNLVAFNTGDGFRVRNGQELLLQGNTIVGNEAFAIACESKRLEGHDARIAKGDIYKPQVDLAVYSNTLVANLDGMMKGRNVTSLKVSNVIDDVDMDSVNERIGGEERELDLEDDDPLGGDLEEALSEFDSVINSAERTLEISTK